MPTKRCPVLTATLVFVLATLVSCIVVMNRRFEAQHRFYPVDSVWNVGIPYAEALGHVSDRSWWDCQNFTIYIPFSSNVERWPFGSLREQVAKGYLHIDSVHVTLLGSGVKIARSLLVRNIPAADSGHIIVGGTQHYVSDDTPILISDTLTIPADEDSISVEFVLRLVDSVTSAVAAKPFLFRLQRREGKKLALDVR